MIDVTDIVSSVIMLVVALLCAYLTKISKDSKNAAEIKSWVEIAVNAAEQAYKVGVTEDRKLYATNFLKDLGLKIDWNTIDTMIEAEVNKIPSAVYTDVAEDTETVVEGFTDKK